MKFSQGFRDTEVGKIPNDWKIKKLGCFGDFRNGINFRREDFGKGYPVINVKNLFSGRYATTKDLAEIKKGTIKNINLYSLQKGDILFARSSVKASGAGQVAMINDLPNNSSLFSGFIIRFRNNSSKLLSNNFINYLLRSRIYRKYLTKIAIGTSIINLTQGTLSNIPIILPPLNEQNWIVNILTDLDRKIELNNQINKNLEQITQAIFKHWFIDFEFPDENGEPYKSSGGEMVDSEMGLIPKGWRFEKLGNLLSEIVTGNRPKGGVSKFKEGIPSIGAESINGLCNYNFSKTKYIPELYFSNMKKGIVKNGDIFLYKDGANLGRKSMFLENFPFKKCCVNSHVFILRANSLMRQSYLYFYLDQKFMTKNIINLNTNSAQPGINSTSVKTLRILLPSGKILNLFNELVFPILRIIFNNSKGNQYLSDIRDVLLPKLMSGEIRVPINNMKVGE